MNKFISPIYKSHGQSFISEKLEIDRELKLLLKLDKDTILNNFDSCDFKIALNIIENLKKNLKLPFPISDHERFRIKKLKENLNILKYLVFRNKFYITSKEKLVFEYPTYLLIELVSACNLRCPMCFQSDKTFTKKPYMGIMDFNLLKKIIDEADLAKIGAITFASRGEPMMHPKFTEILQYCSVKNNIFEIKLNTNGTYLNERNGRSIFENEIDIVVISADHYQKDLYEKYRLNAKFEDVVERVKNFYKLRSEYPESNTEIRISGVNVSGDIDKDKFREFWMQFSDNVSIGDPIERWDTYNNKISQINSACPKLWDRMYVWFDGKVNPCDEDYKSFLSYGQLDTKTIKDVWNSKSLKSLRNAHLNGKRTQVVPCDRCGVDA